MNDNIFDNERGGHLVTIEKSVGSDPVAFPGSTVVCVHVYYVSPIPDNNGELNNLVY